MTKKEQFFNVIKKRKKDLESLGVRKIGIFGSVAREENSDNSDIDVLVQFEAGKKSFRNFLGIIDVLEEELGEEIELITTESLSPYIGPYILKEVQYAIITN